MLPNIHRLQCPLVLESVAQQTEEMLPSFVRPRKMTTPQQSTTPPIPLTLSTENRRPTEENFDHTTLDYGWAPSPKGRLKPTSRVKTTGIGHEIATSLNKGARTEHKTYCPAVKVPTFNLEQSLQTNYSDGNMTNNYALNSERRDVHINTTYVTWMGP